jgi:hypothetical protein
LYTFSLSNQFNILCNKKKQNLIYYVPKKILKKDIVFQIYIALISFIEKDISN